MIGTGVMSARDLLACDFDDPDSYPKIKESWKNTVECPCEKLKFELGV